MHSRGSSPAPECLSVRTTSPQVVADLRQSEVSGADITLRMGWAARSRFLDLRETERGGEAIMSQPELADLLSRQLRDEERVELHAALARRLWKEAAAGGARKVPRRRRPPRLDRRPRGSLFQRGDLRRRPARRGSRLRGRRADLRGGAREARDRVRPPSKLHEQPGPGSLPPASEREADGHLSPDGPPPEGHREAHVPLCDVRARLRRGPVGHGLPKNGRGLPAERGACQRGVFPREKRPRCSRRPCWMERLKATRLPEE
jgi:hypothetical protein